MNIRPLRAEDVAGVASLWQYWFRGKTRTPAPGLTDYVRRLYLERPWFDSEIPSLVAEDDAGRLLGVIGSTVSRFRYRDRPVRLACVMPPLVDEALAPTTIASFLLRKYLSGPQEVTISDGGHPKFERIWETLGGEIAHLQSLRWIKVFRPLTLALEAAKRPSLRRLKSISQPLDRLLARAKRLGLAPPTSPLSSEPLTPERFVSLLPVARQSYQLTPDYDAAYLAWLWAEMGAISSQGELQTATVMEGGRALGWYVYYLQPGGISRVMHLAAAKNRMEQVLDHLFAQAQAGGSAALLGRLEPRLRRPLAERRCLYSDAGSLLMLHSRDPALSHAILAGQALLSRLEGENWYWWGIISPTVPVGEHREARA
jgi:hypothetical protein